MFDKVNSSCTKTLLHVIVYRGLIIEVFSSLLIHVHKQAELGLPSYN